MLDRVVDEPEAGNEEGKLGYRLQKLSSAGVVLGSVTLPVQTYTAGFYPSANPLIGLAVDSTAHRVYALVEGILEEGRSKPVARELVAWSTVPNGSKELVKAPGYPEDSLTHAALIAGASVLEPSEANGELDLFAPEALSVDPSNHDVVIEAQKGLFEAQIGGPTVLQRVVTEEHEEGGTIKKPGELGESWVADKTSTAPAEEQGDGLFTSTDGSFGIDLYRERGEISNLVDVSANFKEPKPSFIAPDTTSGIDLDQAPTIDNRETINSREGRENGAHGELNLEPYTAGSPITQLTNNLYATRYGQLLHATDPQSVGTSWGGLPYFWTQDSESKNIANMGIRLFTAEGAVVTTIGGQAQGQPCNLDTEQLAVAAGSNGSVFVLSQPNVPNGNTDDQVIELAPGGKGACPQPSGSLTLNGKSGTSFSFPVGTNVTLADTVERKGETPYRFDWVLLNSSSLAVEDLNTQIEAPTYKWPAPSTSHTFTKAGTYYATAAVYGDYGLTYIATVKITIH
ncbi:MAG TPA: hypothetical protein VGH60_02270 [Solirubrobacteraceae bacterium]